MQSTSVNFPACVKHVAVQAGLGKRMRRPEKLVGVPAILSIVISLMVIAPTLATEVPYKWNNVAIGGGGYVTGMVIHPTAANRIYIRTDVGGAYSWDESNDRWIPIMDWAPPSKANNYGIESLAVDPYNPDIVYLAAGLGDYTNGDVLKSTDGGKSFSPTGLALKMAGNGVRDGNPLLNGEERKYGERLMVDPNNGNVIYFGSRYNGLWRTTNGGVPGQAGKWAAIKLPDDNPNIADPVNGTRANPVNGTSFVGISFVLFNKATAANGMTQTLFAAVYGKGIYASYDGGSIWRLMDLNGMPTKPTRGVIAPDGTLLVAHESGIAKYYKNGETWAWKNITPADSRGTVIYPSDSRGDEPDNFCGISMDPFNPSIVIAAKCNSDKTSLEAPFKNNNPIYRSWDKGDIWNPIFSEMDNPETNPTHIENTVKWWPYYHFSSDTASLTFDPASQNRVWFTDWYGIWRTDDITNTATSKWKNHEIGHEEVVNAGAMVSPKSGAVKLHNGVSDVGGFSHKSLTAFPEKTIRTQTLSDQFTSTGIDFQEDDPDFVVRVGQDGNGMTCPNCADKYTGRGFYSVDGGDSFTPFAVLPGHGGRVAVAAKRDSADNTRHIVWATQNWEVFYSKDLGAVWTPGRGLPNASVNAAIGGTDIWNYIYPLASDRKNERKFYLYQTEGLVGKFFRSDNGGKDWSVRNVTALPYVNNAGYSTIIMTVAASPTTEGTVCAGFSEEYAGTGKGGLYCSTDSGDNFTQLANIQSAGNIAFGKGLSETAPALYVMGKVGGIEGVFRSNNMGGEWVKINSSLVQIGAKPNAMAGDRQVYGRVYIGTNGRGIFYGETSVRLKSSNIADSFIRHSDYRGRIDSNVAPYMDSEWNIVSGLADSNKISFESTNFPGLFLTNINGDIRIAKNDGTTSDFKTKATWTRRPGLSSGTYASYESLSAPGSYMRHKSGFLYSEADPMNIESNIFKSDATFIEQYE